MACTESGSQTKIQISRRDFVSAGLLALFAGCGDQKSLKEEMISGEESDARSELTPEKHHIGLLMDILQKRGLIQSISVHHPKGADDATPRNPIVYIKDFHAGQGERGLTEEGIRFCFHKYLLLIALHDAGIRRFRCEGYSANDNISPCKVHMSDDRIAPPKQVLWTFQQQKFFVPWANSPQQRNVALPIEELFAASVGDDTLVKGAENPETLESHRDSSRVFRQMREEMNIFFVAMREYMDARGNFPYEYPFSGDGEKILIGSHVFDAGPLRDNLLLCANHHHSMMDGEEAQAREQYIAEHLSDAEVLVFGAHHSNRLKNALPLQDRSVYLVEPIGLPPHHRPWDVHAVESVLQVLQKNEDQ